MKFLIRGDNMKVTKIPALKGIANKVRLDIIQEIYYAKTRNLGG